MFHKMACKVQVIFFAPVMNRFTKIIYPKSLHSEIVIKPYRFIIFVINKKRIKIIDQIVPMITFEFFKNKVRCFLLFEERLNYRIFLRPYTSREHKVYLKERGRRRNLTGKNFRHKYDILIQAFSIH